MKTLYTFILLLFLIACRQLTDSTHSPTNSATDSASSQQAAGIVRAVFVERGNLETQTYSVFLKSRYGVPLKLKEDSSHYHTGNFLIIYDKLARLSDTLPIEGNDISGNVQPVQILNVTKSLAYETFLLNVVMPGDSDWYTSFFVEYRNNRLKELFTIDNFNQPVQLTRKNDFLLAGYVTGRDEVVQYFQPDYPVYVSLKDNLVRYPTPDIQYIGFPTRVSIDIKGYIVTSNADTAQLVIPTGTPVFVDTLYRSLKSVRLILHDSTIVRVSMDEASNKLEPDIAG